MIITTTVSGIFFIIKFPFKTVQNIKPPCLGQLHHIKQVLVLEQDANMLNFMNYNLTNYDLLGIPFTHHLLVETNRGHRKLQKTKTVKLQTFIHLYFFSTKIGCR